MRHCQCLLILLIIIYRLTIKGRNEVTVDLHLFIFKIKHNGLMFSKRKFQKHYQ